MNVKKNIDPLLIERTRLLRDYFQPQFILLTKLVESSWLSPSCSDELVLARGCSTKERTQPGECENHVMETGQEKFCYCSHWLCNSSLSSSRSTWWCLTPAILLSWILNRLSLRALVAHSGQDSGRVLETKT